MHNSPSNGAGIAFAVVTLSAVLAYLVAKVFFVVFELVFLIGAIVLVISIAVVLALWLSHRNITKASAPVGWVKHSFW